MNKFFSELVDEMEHLKILLVRCPVFVLDENVSGYASMGSGEFNSDGVERGNGDNSKDGKHQFKLLLPRR